jgi:hypothetical protein
VAIDLPLWKAAEPLPMQLSFGFLRVFFYAMKLFLLVLVLSCLLPFTSQAQTAPKPAATPEEISLSQYKTLSQPDAPLRLVSAETKWATPGEASRIRPAVSIHFVVENIDERNVRAYTTTYDAGAIGTPKGCLSTNFLPGKILRPGQKHGIGSWRSPWPADLEQSVGIDYVELSDGTVWGADKCQFGERLNGERSGARAQREVLLKILQDEGPDAVLKFIRENYENEAARQAIIRGEKPKIPIEPPSGHSKTWEEGFAFGARVVVDRVVSGNREWGFTEVEVALKRPYDASEAK